MKGRILTLLTTLLLVVAGAHRLQSDTPATTVPAATTVTQAACEPLQAAAPPACPVHLGLSWTARQPAPPISLDRPSWELPPGELLPVGISPCEAPLPPMYGSPAEGAAVPEPATCFLAATAFLGTALYRRNIRRRQARRQSP